MFGRKERYLITDAKLTPGQDRKRREIQYGIFQFLRVPSLLIAGLCLYLHWWLVAAIIVGVTFPLPWIAVVIGNGRGEKKDKREKIEYKPDMNREHYTQRHAPRLSGGTARPIEASHDIIDHEEE